MKNKKLFSIIGLTCCLFCTVFSFFGPSPLSVSAHNGFVGSNFNALLDGANLTYYDNNGNTIIVPQSAYYPTPYDMDNVLPNYGVYNGIDTLELEFDTPGLLSRYLSRAPIFKYENYNFWCTYDDISNVYFDFDEIPGFTNTAYITINSTYLASDYMYHNLDYSFSLGENGSNPLMIDSLSELFDNALYPLKTFGDYNLINFSYLSIEIDWKLSNLNLVDNLRFFIYFDRVNEVHYSEFLELSSQYSQSLVTPTNVDITGSLATTVNSFLQIEIFPNFSFMTLLVCAVTIPLTMWLLKSYFGG